MTVLTQQIQKILCRFCAYYAQGELYRFIYSPSGISLRAAEKGFKPQALIIGRDYYQEQLLSLPIDDKSELAKLLKLQYAQPEYCYQVIRRAEGKSLVNLWQYATDLPAAKLFIPESYLLSQALQPNQVLVQSPLHPLGKIQFVATPYQGCASAFKSTVVSSPLLFSAGTGINLQDIVHSASPELAGRLINGLMSCPSLKLADFISTTKTKLPGSELRALLLPAAAILSVYLGLTSAWLAWQQNSLETQIAAEKSQLRQALSLQDDFNRQQNKLSNLVTFFAQQQPNALVMLTLASLIEDAQIDVLRFVDGRFILLGKTNQAPKDSEAEANTAESDDSNKDKPIYRATEFLEKLISLPNVTDARFDAAVRRSNNYENFTVSFLLNPATAMPDKPIINDNDNTQAEAR
jgi:hypothetical protein